MLVIDRYEGNFAVVEDDEGKTINLPRDMLEKDIPEGSVIVLLRGKYILDKAETEKRKKELFDLQESLFK